MQTYCFRLTTQSAFGTPLVGDTLFGQLCWAVVHQYGESRLNTLLENYQQQPFAVISDAFPAGYLPLPTLPSTYWKPTDPDKRKELKKKQWIELETTTKQAVTNWQEFAKSENALWEDLVKNKLIEDGVEEKKALEIAKSSKKIKQDQPHNSINRQTTTTGKTATASFDPYTMEQIWYSPYAEFDLYVVINENQISLDEIKLLLKNIGQFGFGRDASIGLGKFNIEQIDFHYPEPNNANAYLTLANSAPQNLGFNKNRSYYQITTRFGRHGDIAALNQNPFKKPIILAKTGAIFTPKQYQTKQYIGNGLKHISYAQKNAVHQGYAPVIPVAIEFKK
ncbi:CRISPR type III-A/MTUBE-associated RAMP protein Csm4 [Canicola haemoglobinophilus]|uniref:CRISPR system Cms protein Csm4 n=1 Tax=Canicola haemoglobinophilus TaxID=733 RepID=A0AB38H746_9PAST|nr:type III-A CRISPR-associated RAMP protein Csm4 [Canicola haemoglobinophilus]STO53528.1 CRISPR type III-A/MTUBE-associated RAMP protein Csm4 [Canicola haemoglobinophilus]STO68062.1 CRISPR type III-A/MTUBE-associated RAMP protein Csm4 [Canicola haemoglobinophilus]